MATFLPTESADAKHAISTLLENTPPVLVEVRFPRMGTSPDWYLCDDEEDLAQILDKLGSGVEVYLSSVWDLENTKGAIGLKK